MKRLALGLVAGGFAVFTMSAQGPAGDAALPRPGDRPAANTHSTRSVVMATHGMIATSQPLASAAGLRVLQEGGNAIDAAVTAAAVLAVVEPSMTGIGGDLFAIIYDAKTKSLHALNASGRSAYAATPDEIDQNFTGRDHGDTIYMTAADGQGNFISLIQSLFSDFGSGVVAGETGILLHNRGSGFNLTAGSPDQIGPHKRPLHTLIPAMIMKDGKPWLSYGVMGGDHQAQGHTQVAVNMIDFGMNVQEAGEAARIHHGNNGVQVESAMPESVRAALIQRGHKVTQAVGAYGGYQGIFFDQRTGVLMGGSDVRKDGLAIGW